MQRELGITTIFVTHDQEEALSMSDRIVVMHQAREQIGAPSEIYNDPRTRFVASFVGTLNLLDGKIVDASVEAPSKSTASARRLGAASTGPSLAMSSTWGSGPRRCVLGAGSDDRNTLAGVIEDVAFLGAVVRVRVRLKRAAIIVDTFNSGANDLPARGSVGRGQLSAATT